MKELSIARRYATAFFQLALELKKTQLWQEELSRVLQATQDEPNLLAVLGDFRVDVKTRLNLLDQLNAPLKLSGETLSFLKLLLQKKRIELFAQIYNFYVELFEASEKIATADLIVSHETVAGEIQNRVQTMLAEKLGRRAECRVTVDPALLGGFVVQVGDQVFDASYKGRLEKMKDALLAQ